MSLRIRHWLVHGLTWSYIVGFVFFVIAFVPSPGDQSPYPSLRTVNALWSLYTAATCGLILIFPLLSWYTKIMDRLEANTQSSAHDLTAQSTHPGPSGHPL